MNTPKHILKYGLVALAIIAVFLGTYYVGFVKDGFGMFDVAIDTKVEAWGEYKSTSKTLGEGVCQDTQFATIVEAINAQPRTSLTLDNGLTLIATDNPLHWRNSEFRDYYYFPLSQCRTSEDFIPVRAYPDKLLWKNSCTWQTILIGCERTEQALERWEREYAQSSSREFNEAGLRFHIPEHIFHAQNAYPSENVYRFSFYAEGNTVPDTSSIGLSIPLNLSVQSEDDPKADIPEDALKTMMNWGTLQGDRYVYHRQVEKTETTIGWQGTITKEIYPLSKTGQNLILQYDHSIHDDTLETLWNGIHADVKMDYGDNLPIYQHRSENLNTNSIASDWKIYINQDYHFTFQYPPDWTINDGETNLVAIIPPNSGETSSIELGPEIAVTVTNAIPDVAPANASSADIAEKYNCNHDQQSLEINGIAVTRQTESCFAEYLATYCPVGLNFITFSWAKGFEQDHPEYSKILSTFQPTAE